ncbi:transcription factor bHLH10 [Prunus yedoensis var. nudiflora]|uniref:Transcription factor bHLH10 n=1 Tax=Prunus yedoensis var. nudiflora TaxID=2094558 RepID=A0A314UFX2_PRUYE|nr:transcription factor bHLH10 [Prunus yedoensis var. nudiflora]
MYEDTVCCNFDPNSMPESAETVLNVNPLPPPPQVLMPSTSETHKNNNFAVAKNLRLSIEEISYPHQQDHHAAMEIELQNELGFNPYSTNTDQSNNSSHLLSFEQQTNGDTAGGVDAQPGTVSSVFYDPLLHLNLPPQPPLPRELYQSLFSSGRDEREGIGGVVYSDGINNGRQFENGVLEFSREMGSIGRERDVEGTNYSATGEQRRVQLNGKYKALRDLVPNPTKTDRASIVRYAINYIRELLWLVEELKLLVEKKRCGRGRHQTEQDGGAGDGESCKPLGDPHDQSYNNGSLRNSWLQRKSKDTEVDIRIIDDEVTIKLVQTKKINVLLYVSKLLDELQLDLHHAAGEHVGNSYSFLFNTKMHEGSFLYTKAIGDKLFEVLDGQYAAVPPTSSY